MPQEVYDHCAKAMEKGAQAYEKWVSMMEAYKAQYPDCYKAYQEAFAKGMPAGVDIEKLMQVDNNPSLLARLPAMCSISSRIWCPTCLAAALTWAPPTTPF